MRADDAELLERGRVLFNAGRFFEAHEVWEEQWRQKEGDSKRFLQGLIQIAAGFHKAGEGSARPCARLLEAGLEKLAAVREPAILAFREALQGSLAQARRWERGEAPGVTQVPALGPFEGVK